MNLVPSSDEHARAAPWVSVDTGGTVDCVTSYEDIRQRARDLADAGDLRGALAVYDLALEEARRLGEADRIDRALCNRMAVAISLGDCIDVRAPLRTVLMRRTSDGSAFLAAYNLSHAYEASKDYKKGLFYAQVARRHAAAAQDPLWLASSYNQQGNCLTGDSHFERAAAAYLEALELLPDEPSPRRAAITLNLGYCVTTLGREGEGLRLALASLRCFRRFGSRHYCGWAHLDLCHAYALHGRLARAIGHGRRALALAEETGEAGLIKNTLFMLGEAEQQAGDIDAAYDCFSRLQRDFYPDQPQLVELMLAVDLRQMVNLRA